MYSGAVRDRMMGAPRKVVSTSMIMARTRSPERRFSFGIMSPRRRRPSTRPDSTMRSPLSMRLTVPTNILSPRDMKSLSSISRSASRIFCRMTCLAACAPIRPIGRLSIGLSMKSPSSMSGIWSRASLTSSSASGFCRPASSGTTSHRRKVSYLPLSRSTATRISTSPGNTFLVAEASASSTAPKTTSRSTFFSREMASTNINSSRFISQACLSSFSQLILCRNIRNRRNPGNLFGFSPLEINHGRQARLMNFIQRESERLQRRGNPLFADFLTRFDHRFIAPHNLPASLTTRRISGLNTLECAAKFLAVGRYRRTGACRHANRGLQGDVNQLTRKTFKIFFTAQGPVYAGGTDFQPRIVGTLHFQHELQLASDFFAIFRSDKPLGPSTVRHVDRDTQQATAGALDIDQLVTQPGDSLPNRLLQSHSVLKNQSVKTNAQKKWAVK